MANLPPHSVTDPRDLRVGDCLSHMELLGVVWGWPPIEAWKLGPGRGIEAPCPGIARSDSIAELRGAFWMVTDVPSLVAYAEHRRTLYAMQDPL